MASFKRVLAAFALFLSLSVYAENSTAPETWFHIIGGNASKEGIVADLDAIKAAGLSGIQFFHGNGKLWPGVTNPIPCLSGQWVDLVKFMSDECHQRGLTFKMQNCPGWSMSGGPWITSDKAMRKLVCFEPDKKPTFDADDDFHEIGSVTFPISTKSRMMTLMAPSKFNHGWCYEPKITFSLWNKDVKTWERECPTGCFSDTWESVPIDMTFDITGCEGDELRCESPHKLESCKPVFDNVRRLDNWQAKAGQTLRSFRISENAAAFVPDASKTLVFGHVNAKRRNYPAPPEATGWECDKMDSRGFEANWEGYLGKALKAGVKIDGTLVDSWECGVQSWTWNIENEFEKRNGYALRSWLPALFGYIVKDVPETEKFLLDWRNTCAQLIEENYYGTIVRLSREHGMSVQYETAFGDVVPGDILRYWKYADEPMCEFWSPHDNDQGYVGSYNFKPILPCASAAHLYGKNRVSAESLTSFKLTFDENFLKWKKIIDAHFGRGVTHIVFHTYTHNPIVGGKAPGSSFGGNIGSPFLRLQPWWKYMKDFTSYLEFCGHELERGQPVIDILMYLGDDVNHKPSESKLLFDNCYKYDYLNNDVLTSRLSVKNGRLVLPDGMSYRVIWIPKNTYLLPKTEARLAELEKQGARIVRGDFVPDWPSPLKAFTGRDGKGGVHWYQRRDGTEDIFFIAEKNGTSAFMYFKDGKYVQTINAVTRKPIELNFSKESVTEISLSPTLRGRATPSRADKAATLRTYECTFTSPDPNPSCPLTLSLGDVRSWATVFVNDKEVTRLWCPPYSCDISDFVKPGENRLRIEVTSTIYNQLVIDAGKPERERQTWTLAGPKQDAPLHESGLLGPVVLIK